jgi:hypothetical protein
MKIYPGLLVRIGITQQEPAGSTTKNPVVVGKHKTRKSI